MGIWPRPCGGPKPQALSRPATEQMPGQLCPVRHRFLPATPTGWRPTAPAHFGPFPGQSGSGEGRERVCGSEARF